MPLDAQARGAIFLWFVVVFSTIVVLAVAVGLLSYVIG